jgi:phytoene dehydrogenase-like protein
MVDEALRAQVVVVGARVAGLTAATYLARAGVDVLVVERASDRGGCAASRVIGGFDLGVHALYTGAGLEDPGGVGSHLQS